MTFGYVVEIKAFGGHVVEQVYALTAAEARQIVLRRHQIEITVKPAVDVDEQIAKARAEQ